MNASEYRVIAFSTANHPDSWSIEAENQSWGIVEFKTNMDAKLAEGIFNSMQQEINSLRIRLRVKIKDQDSHPITVCTLSRNDALEEAAKIVASAAPGFCGGKGEIVLYTCAEEIRALKTP